MNNRKPYMAPAIKLFQIEASSMICVSVTETEVCPGEYAPDPPKKSYSIMSDGGSWDVE